MVGSFLRLLPSNCEKFQSQNFFLTFDVHLRNIGLDILHYYFQYYVYVLCIPGGR